MAVKPVPDGFHTVTPYLIVPGVVTLIDFLQQAFDAQPLIKMMRADDTVGHAEVKIGDSIVMMGEPMDDMPPMPGSLYLYVNDTDAVYQRALQAGATSIMAPADQFYGDRSAGVKDQAGNQWWIATHKEDVSPEEMTRRAAAAGLQPR
jgi:uncharacterized glyoxalase superfamily protein PhnB